MLLIRLFRPAGQLLQVRYACFVIVNSGSHDVGRIAGFEGIADLSRTMLFARLWPPVLDPNSGRSLRSLAQLWEELGPLGASQSGSVLADEIRPDWMGGYGCFDAVENKNIGHFEWPTIHSRRIHAEMNRLPQLAVRLDNRLRTQLQEDALAERVVPSTSS